jgi:mannose-6-phosphate isomerase-like protein (cupin superfamily)
MKETIKQGILEQEFYTPERCYITELSNSATDPQLSIARARVAPGVTTSWHLLKQSVERYCIISGMGLVEVGALAPQQVSAGDVVIIPAMCRQRITNIGQDDLIFLAICTPRFMLDDYQDLEVALV